MSFIGEPGVDTCQGDGGSPLVCAEKPKDETSEQTYYQVRSLLNTVRLKRILVGSFLAT